MNALNDHHYVLMQKGETKLCIGHLPGRKSIFLYVDKPGTIKALCSFTDETRVREFLSTWEEFASKKFEGLEDDGSLSV